MFIGRRYEFQSAHRLPYVPASHKCANVHGHTYALEVEIAGDASESAAGWVLDFGHLDEVVKELVIKPLDHRYLNDVDGLTNPTSERIVDWIWDRLSVYGWPTGVTIERVRVSENGHSWAEKRVDLDIDVEAEIDDVERRFTKDVRDAAGLPASCDDSMENLITDLKKYRR